MVPVLSVVTPPAALVTTADAKIHLRIDTSEDDALIDSYVAAATQSLDPATEGWLGRALGEQTLQLTAGHFPGWGDAFDWRFGWNGWLTCHVEEIRLPCPPVQSVKSVVYIDPTGASVTLDPATYALSERILFPLGGASWPATAARPDAVKIQFVAGYGPSSPRDDQKTVPAPIIAAIKLMVGTLYGNRNDDPAGLNLTSERLLAPYKVFQ